jgi:DNA repair protein RadC
MKNNISEITVSYRSSKIASKTIKCSSDAYDLLKQSWNENTIELFEEFKIILLNRANNVLGIYQVSSGGVSGTIADAKLIFSVALKCAASSIILCHNHPSGQLKPSEADKTLTKSLVKAGELLQISVLDHVILTSSSYYSFADEGQL